MGRLVRFVAALALIVGGLPLAGVSAQETAILEPLCVGTSHQSGQEVFDERTGERVEPLSTESIVVEVFNAEVGDLVTVRVQTPSGEIVSAVGRVESDGIADMDLPLFETGTYTPLEIELARPAYADDPPMQVVPITSAPAAGIIDPFEVNAAETECSRSSLGIPLVGDPGPIASTFVDLLGFGGDDLTASGLFVPGTEITEQDGDILIDGVPLSACEADASCPYADPGSAWNADGQCDTFRYAEPSGPSTLPCGEADITAFGATAVTFARPNFDPLIPRANMTTVTTGLRFPQAGEEWWAMWATFDGPPPPAGTFAQQLAFVGNTGLGQPFEFFDPFRWDTYQGSDLWLQLVGDQGNSTLAGLPVVWSGTEGAPAAIDMVWVTVDRQIMLLVPREQIPILQGIAVSVHVHDGTFGRTANDVSAVDSAPNVNIPGGRGPTDLAPVGPAVTITGESTPAVVAPPPSSSTTSSTAAAATGSTTGSTIGSTGSSTDVTVGAPAAPPDGGGSAAPLLIGGAILLGAGAGGYYFSTRRRSNVGITPIGERRPWANPAVSNIDGDPVVDGTVDYPIVPPADVDGYYDDVFSDDSSGSSSYSGSRGRSGCLPAVIPLLLLLPLLPLIAPILGRLSRRHTSGSPLRRRRMRIEKGILMERNGRPLDGRYIYVLSRSGRFWVAPAKPEGAKRPFHTDLMPVGRIAAAGEIRVDRGRLTRISDGSGHFRPGAALIVQALERLAGDGVDLEGVDVVFVRWKPKRDTFTRDHRVRVSAPEVLAGADVAAEALAEAVAFERAHRRSWNWVRDIELRRILDRPLHSFGRES